MTLTQYLRNPRVLTNAELDELDREIDAITARIEELDERNCDDATLLDHYGGRLDAIEIIIEKSAKLARLKESGLRLIQGGAA